MDENAVPECQLDRIQSLVHAVAPSARIKGRRPQHFWLDTLCVPAGAEMRPVRRAAVAAMVDTYKAASAALVLSSTLEAVTTTARETERARALYLSNWNRRPWTSQEGMLA